MEIDRVKIYEQCLNLGMVELHAMKIAKNATNPYCKTAKTKSDCVLGYFDWINSTERREYWVDVHDYYLKEELKSTCHNSHNATLTNSEIQMLISILKSSFNEATDIKKNFKSHSSELWKRCNKDTESGQKWFKLFSAHMSCQKHWKEKEKKIASLISKLKDMR
jgi:hypothetical protein